MWFRARIHGSPRPRIGRPGLSEHEARSVTRRDASEARFPIKRACQARKRVYPRLFAVPGAKSWADKWAVRAGLSVAMGRIASGGCPPVPRVTRSRVKFRPVGATCAQTIGNRSESPDEVHPAPMRQETSRPPSRRAVASSERRLDHHQEDDRDDQEPGEHSAALDPLHERGNAGRRTGRRARRRRARGHGDHPPHRRQLDAQ